MSALPLAELQGLWFLSVLKTGLSDYFFTKIIMLSARGRGVEIEKGMDMGADEYGASTPFRYRKSLTFDYDAIGASCGGSYDLSNFPVLVSLSGNWLKTAENGGHVYSPAGYDIIFRAADGRTALSHD